MNKVKEANKYQAQIITAVLGALILILVTAVPALAEYQEVLLEIALVIVGLIIGESIQKGQQA